MNELTPRQLECLYLAALGLQARDIGEDLRIAEQTVRHTLQAARARLEARNTTHAVYLATRAGWLPVRQEIGGSHA